MTPNSYPTIVPTVFADHEFQLVWSRFKEEGLFAGLVAATIGGIGGALKAIIGYPLDLVKDIHLWHFVVISICYDDDNILNYPFKAICFESMICNKYNLEQIYKVNICIISIVYNVVKESIQITLFFLHTPNLNLKVTYRAFSIVK